MKNRPSHLYSIENDLTLKISPEQVSYEISDPNKRVILRQELNGVFDFKSNIETFREFINQPELDIQSENVKIIFEHCKYQIVPNEYYRTEDVNMLFYIVHGKEENRYILQRNLPKWNTHLIFSVPSNVFMLIKDRYPESDIEHSLAEVLNKKVAKDKNMLYVLSSENRVDIVCVKDNQLQITNTFEVNNIEDVAYFVLSTFEQFDLDIYHFPVSVSSTTQNTTNIVNLLKEYVVNIKHI